MMGGVGGLPRTRSKGPSRRGIAEKSDEFASPHRHP